MRRSIHAVVMFSIAACSSSPARPNGDNNAGVTGTAGTQSNVGAAGTTAGAGSAQDSGLATAQDGGGTADTGDASSVQDAGNMQDASGDAAQANGMFALPPLNEGLDYQLGGNYTPPAGVKIISRDRTAAIAPGLYNICYVNGFQIQPGEESQWMTDHPDLILRDEAQMPVIDQDWNEMLIDVSTAEKRAGVAEIVGGWIQGCAADGFDAVEIDNLDSFSRSGGRLTEDNAVAAIKLFSDAAHAAGLAIAQKNSAELVGRRSEMGTDFVVAEECNRYNECDVYTGAYGEHVLVIEYRRADFDKGCSAFPELSIVLRDRNLVGPSNGNYSYDGC